MRWSEHFRGTGSGPGNSEVEDGFADMELPGNQEQSPLTHAAETCCRL